MNHTVAVSTKTYLYFVDRALTGLRQIAEQLGDVLVNTKPPLPGANTAFGLITHCLGVVDYWAGQLVGGRDVVRDRVAEFAATGTVAELAARITATAQQLAVDVAKVDSPAPPTTTPNPDFIGPDRELDQGGVLWHVFEELSQHLGQLEVMRDALLVDAGRAEPPAVPADRALHQSGAVATDAFEPLLPWLRAKRSVKWHRPGPDVIPAWVADMDFAVPPAVRAALVDLLDRGDLGYPDWEAKLHPLATPFAARMQQRFGWSPDPGHVRGVTDVIQGLQRVLDLASNPGDRVVLQTPNYPPFRHSVPTMNRVPVELSLTRNGDTWRHDLDQLEAELTAAPAKILLLVNPHNPTGRVFDRAELQALADLAERHDLVVVSDEIHADLVFAPHTHIPFASLGADVAARTVTLTSATKAFNLAGIRTAVAHIGPEDLRARWDAAPPDLHGVSSVLGITATSAAWNDSDAWLAGVVEHLQRQRDRLTTALAATPGAEMLAPQATYLAWTDWTDARLEEDAAAFFLRRASVFASPGPDYGGTAAQLRLNFATSTALLDDIIGRLQAALGA